MFKTAIFCYFIGHPMKISQSSDLSLPIDQLRSVGSRNLPRLLQLGIKTVRHLLWHFPARYEDYSRILPIAEIEPGQKVNVQGEIVMIATRMIFPNRRRMTITDAVVRDHTGSIRVIWFNQPYIANSLVEGSLVSIAGKVANGKRGVYLSSPTYEKIGGEPAVEDGYRDIDSGSTVPALKHTGGLIPVYPETRGITSKYLRFLIKPLLEELDIPDPLPSGVSEKYGFFDINRALRSVHYPGTAGDAEQAKERLAFDELLLFQLKALIERRRLNQLRSAAIAFDQEHIQQAIAGLPFELTGDQKTALWEILKDLQKTYPMNRLLEGDVGSGKTVVAFLAAVQAAQRGYQTVFMAPTEVLANQHFQTMQQLAPQLNLRIGLMTGSDAKLNGSDMTKAGLKRKTAQGGVDIVIGTHAVIQKGVRFKSLALVVIDEQHRFGIEQRAALLKNQQPTTNDRQQLIPHLLSMTATPIPRTLALTIFGDLDISIIKEKPKNRRKIITRVVSPLQRRATQTFIRSEVKKGRQVFVICPRIEQATDNQQQTTGTNPKQVVSRQLSVVGKPVSQMKLVWAEVKAVQEEYEKLSKQIFPDLKVAMLHGKMKPKEKASVMREFKSGWHDILVSTSVVEVGVDVPNATIMLVESSERFGLAQLHQFRGRVGRGEHQSYCLLLTSGDAGVNKRLEALVDCDDGFELAEKDMAIRGPGEFFGVKQSGLPDLAMASLANVELIKKARLEARTLLKEDPKLVRYPLIRDRLEDFQKLHHFE